MFEARRAIVEGMLGLPEGQHLERTVSSAYIDLALGLLGPLGILDANMASHFA